MAGSQNIFYALLLFMLLFMVGCAEPTSDVSDNPAITFYLGKEVISSYDLTQMQGEIAEYGIQIHDIFYHREQEYRAFQLCDLLQLGFGDQVTEDGSVFFTALDGYEASAKKSRLCEGDAYLAFAMVGVDDWEILPEHNAKPGPFYLVWSDATKTPKHGYPWPWQISAIRWARFATAYSGLVPNGLSADSPAHFGFEFFRARCIGCHAIFGEGGDVGPDLGGILGYRSEEIVRAFTKMPSQFRLSKMPDLKNISEANLDQLIAYFKYLDAVKKGGFD